jgi:hypothetical protein
MISEPERQAVREKYRNNVSKRKEALLSVVGLSKRRTELPDTETHIKRLFKRDRLKRIWKGATF